LLHDTLAERGARLILRALADQPEPMSQPEVGATYAGKLSRHDGRINWACEAHAIERQVRAFDPWPGTFTTLDGSTLKILAVALADGEGPPGTVLDDGLLVACGDALPNARGDGSRDAPGDGSLVAPGDGSPNARVDRLPDASGSGALRLTRVQLAGRAAMDAAAFLRGHPVAPGTRLGL
jgi:methionyl-tRNA formyltransferase